MEDKRLALTNSPTVKLPRKDDIVIPLDIVHVIFGHIASSFDGDVYDPVVIGRSRGELYSPGEVALKRCFAHLSLVCQSWNALANRRMNHLLVIKMLYVTLDPLLEWLYAHPLLPPLVHHLRLVTGDKGPHWSIQREQGPLAGYLTASKLRRVLTCFPQLRVLELVDVHFEPEFLYASLGTDQIVEELIMPETCLSPLTLEHFAFYDTGKFCSSPQSIESSLSWLGNVGSILIAITSDQQGWAIPRYYIEGLMKDPGKNLLHIATITSVILTARDIPLNPSQCLSSSAFKTCLPKKIYVQAAAFNGLDICDFLRPVAPGIDELCLDLTQACYPQAIIYDTMESPLGDFDSLFALTLKVDLPSAPNLLHLCERAIHNVLRYFTPLPSLHSLSMVVAYGRHEATTDENRWFPLDSWVEMSSKLLTDCFATALCDPLTSQGLLSLDHINFAYEDPAGSRVPISLERQGCFEDVFARVDAAELLRF